MLLLVPLALACDAPAQQPGALPTQAPTSVAQVSASATRAPVPVASFGLIGPSTTPLPGSVLDQIASAPARFTGNDLEAEDRARIIRDAVVNTQMPASVHVDLLPLSAGSVSGAALTAYRVQVRTAVATVVLFPAGEVEWLGRISASDRALLLTALVNSTHNPIDGYPNAVVRVTVANDRGRVLGVGIYEPSTAQTAVFLATQ